MPAMRRVRALVSDQPGGRMKNRRLTGTSIRLTLYVTVLVFLSWPAIGTAEKLRGTVVDSAGFVVPDAEVPAKAGPSSVSIHTISNGEFELNNISPPADVSVHAAGFAPTVTTWDGQPSL